ncbi:type II secretion system protein [Providencia sp. PROV266]|uniref:type II secretion system protein n=1 Tax=Providencia sp. PROV266 TaxID=2949954 RepID=UPI00234AB344|nr:prepilin-type N-terminal cleavage/methylation domain-containing protein [Providencia sp. PROV266]
MKLNRGFTLLEMIIVISIIGLVMLAAAHYLKKMADEKKRQITTDGIVSEMFNFNHFVQSHYIEIENNETGELNQILNPLYDKNNNSIYSKRNTNNVNVNISKENYLNWASENNQEQDRNYFIDKRCIKNTTEISSGMSMTQDFLKCTLDSSIKTSEFSLERVDMIGNANNRDITRIDYFLTYTPFDGQKEAAEFETYTSNFINSFNQKALAYDQASIIERNTKSPADWELMKTTGTDVALQLGESITQLDQFKKNKTYGIRFSFYMNEGVYLKSDGSVSAEKLCWSEKTKALGPCLKPYNTADDQKNKLVLVSGALDKNEQAPGLCWSKNENKIVSCLGMKKESSLDDPSLYLTEFSEDGTEKAGTLIAKVITENQYLNKSKQTGKYEYVDEYRTPVEVVYLDFTGQRPPVETSYEADPFGDEDNIVFKQQECPIHPKDKSKKLYPRLAASISSIVAIQDSSGKFEGVDLSTPSQSRKNTRLENQGVMGNIIIQVNKNNENWVISASTSASNGKDINNYISPKSLSIIAMMWCSSMPQDD